MDMPALRLWTNPSYPQRQVHSLWITGLQDAGSRAAARPAGSIRCGRGSPACAFFVADERAAAYLYGAAVPARRDMRICRGSELHAIFPVSETTYVHYMYIEHMSPVPDKKFTYDGGTDPAFAPGEEEQAAYAAFSAIVRRLRRDCPWDREQTHESVKHLLIEEAYEAVSAIDEADPDGLCEELGDLLLHVAFHGVIAEGEGRFSIADIIRRETDKLVRRHPHVFRDAQADNPEEVARNWEQIKLAEGSKKSALEGVPRRLPGLLRAHRIQQKAAGVGFDFPERSGAWEKVCEEIREFAEVDTPDAPGEEREREFGDVLFALVNYARMSGLNAENALSRANDAFARRFRHIEERLAETGRSPAESTLAEMDVFWEEAKARERK